MTAQIGSIEGIAQRHQVVDEVGVRGLATVSSESMLNGDAGPGLSFGAPSLIVELEPVCTLKRPCTVIHERRLISDLGSALRAGIALAGGRTLLS